MLTWWIGRRIDAFEREYDYDMSYAREMLRASPKALLLYTRATALSQWRGGLPLEAWYAARLVGMLHGDCGPCTQLLVTLAERAGVEPEILRAIVASNYESLPEPVQLVVRFARATLERTEEANPLRDRIRDRFGGKGLIGIAFALLSSQMYPVLKYTLGYGHACQRVRVAGQLVSNGLPISARASSNNGARALAELPT